MTIQSIGNAGRVHEFTMGDRLRKARINSGLSQSELATLIGVAMKTIGRYEDGSPPKRPVVLSWALATGTSLDWLETGRVNDKAPDPDGSSASPGVHPPGLEPGTH